MIGRRVTSPWHGHTGTVVRWEPLGAALCDCLVRRDDGAEIWLASHDLRPADSLGPLPGRQAERERARRSAAASLEKTLADHVRDFHKPWPGCEFGKAILGNAIVEAIKRFKDDKHGEEG